MTSPPPTPSTQDPHASPHLISPFLSDSATPPHPPMLSPHLSSPSTRASSHSPSPPPTPPLSSHPNSNPPPTSLVAPPGPSPPVSSPTSSPLDPPRFFRPMILESEHAGAHPADIAEPDTQEVDVVSCTGEGDSNATIEHSAGRLCTNQQVHTQPRTQSPILHALDQGQPMETTAAEAGNEAGDQNLGTLTLNNSNGLADLEIATGALKYSSQPVVDGITTKRDKPLLSKPISGRLLCANGLKSNMPSIKQASRSTAIKSEVVDFAHQTFIPAKQSILSRSKKIRPGICKHSLSLGFFSA
jgi:hypothetical protein